MKKRLFTQAGIISFLFLALMGAITYLNFVSWSRRVNDLNNVPARRYVDVSHRLSVNNYESNFFKMNLDQFDNVFMKTLYLLVIVQTFLLVRRLKVRNAVLISAYCLSSIIGGLLIFAVNTFHEYFVTGMNPYLMYVPVFFLVLQIVIWVYLNMLLFKRLAEKSSER